MRNRHGGRADLKVERKLAEKYRRMHMKTLYFKLSSIIPADHRTTAKDVMTKQDNLDQATSYIKYLRERIENLKQRRLVQSSTARNEMGTGYLLPIIEVKYQDLNLEILLISGVNKSFMFHEVINVLEEEGAEAVSTRIGLEPSRVSERLKELVKCLELAVAEYKVQLLIVLPCSLEGIN
ncbi:Transcription factor bHLH36 [Musa troglodytarum]|uniref:Transcription factor bHLH36 n=1 Tax=Musa troglodytarum TaxID=320322 RepID=A0A9E7EZZ5_9LILI|nr:Transcription factor bHLH36 [Musa troglodytarum]URD88181.1 Transcription factor bHLH36 [Musa troglodytarum]